MSVLIEIKDNEQIHALTNNLCMVTVPHTGTRWMANNFKQSNIPLEFFHFGEYKLNERNTYFTLLRNPLNIVISHLRRNVELELLRKTLPHSMQLQQDAIDIGLAEPFPIEHSIYALKLWKKLPIKDYKEMFSLDKDAVYSSGSTPEPVINQEVIDFAEELRDKFVWYQQYKVEYDNNSINQD